jgi:mono/diheme cytochrome c family protein
MRRGDRSYLDANQRDRAPMRQCPAGESRLPPQKARSTMRYVLNILAATLIVTTAAMTTALAASPAELRGRAFARNNCAKCHSIDRVSPSPLKIAPPFRTLHKRYPVDTLAEAFAEGIDTGHPTMPMFQLEPDQINDLLAFLKTLE